MVIVDAPPVLAVSDAAIIGAPHRGDPSWLPVPVATRFARLEQAVKRLAHAGVQVKGLSSTTSMWTGNATATVTRG